VVWESVIPDSISALASSVFIAIGFEVVAAVQAGPAYKLFVTAPHIAGVALQTHHKALILVPLTILVWVTVTFMTRPADAERLRAFYRRVRPGGAWGPIARGMRDVRADGLSRGAMVGWAGGVALVYGLTFGIGKLVLGAWAAGSLLLSIALVGGLVASRVMRD